MECTQPFVPRGLISSVVTIKKAMVQLMEKITNFYAAYLADFQFLETCVRRWRSNPMVKQQKDDVDWVGGDQQEHQRIGHQNEAFDGMHC